MMVGMLTSVSMLKTNPDTYARCHEILGIPDTVEWSDLKVEFGTDDVGTVTLVLLPTGEQVRALAELAITKTPSSCVAE